MTQGVDVHAQRYDCTQKAARGLLKLGAHFLQWGWTMFSFFMRACWPVLPAALPAPTRRSAKCCATGPQSGLATVEFALLLPMLLALLLGVVEIGLALYAKAVLTQACREGARAGIVLRSPKLSEADVSAIVQQRVQSQLISLLPTTPVQVSVLQSSPAAYPNTLQVSASYTFKGLAWGELMRVLGSPLVIRASTVMVHE